MTAFYQNKWTGERRRDPWARANEWRFEHPVVAHKYNKYKLFPGLLYGSGAFVVYCIGEYLYKQAYPSSSSGHH